MKITTITAHAGRTFNHPYEQFANFKPGISLTATLESLDWSPESSAKQLQAMAEKLADEQKAAILKRCEVKNAEENLRFANDSLSRAEEQAAREPDNSTAQRWVERERNRVADCERQLAVLNGQEALPLQPQGAAPRAPADDDHIPF